MFDTKIEVDKHVDNCLKKINDENERNLRSFAFAKLYFKVGDYEQARRYVSCYLAVKPLSTEGLNLLGKTLEKQGKRELAVEAYRKSLDLDSKQNSLVIKICELLASDEIGFDLSGARYYCEKAQLFDPHNPIVFSLKERLVAAESQDPNDVTELLLSELSSRPTDVHLRVRLLHHLLQHNHINEAYKHVFEIEHKNLPIFMNNLVWYEAVTEVLIHYQQNSLVDANLTWEFWMLMVTVLDKLVALTLAEHTNSLKSTSECAQVLFNFDQTLTTAIEKVGNCSEKPLIQEFLNHYKAQLCFHFVTLLFKQAKRDLLKYKDAMQIALPLLFAAYHTKPADLRCLWLDYSPEVRRLQIQRWHREAAFRCSQTGHILLAIAKDRKMFIMEKAVQMSSGVWREQLFKKLFITRDHQAKLKTSCFVSCPNLVEITIRLPEINDIIKYDEVSQLLYPDSLHLFIWICLCQKLSTFRCTVYEGLQYSIKNLNNCAAESLNLLDIESFLYCAALCVQQQQEEKWQQAGYNKGHLNIYPASITDLLGTVNQTKWLKGAYKMYRNEYGAELSELRLNLIRGIEVVRCVGNHGLDVQLLVKLATIFTERAKNCTKQSEIEFNDARAELYWKAALPLLEKLEKNQAVSYASNRLFEYKSKEMTPSKIVSDIDDGKLFLATQSMKKKEYEKALHLFETVRSPYASFYQAHIYKAMANEQITHHKENVTSEMRSQHVILLSRARDCLYLTVDRLRDPLVDRKHPLNCEIGTEIEKIERLLSRYDSDTYVRNDGIDGTSEENLSSAGSMGDHINNSYFSAVGNSMHYNEPVTPVYEGRNLLSSRIRFDSARREARPSPERLDAQLRQMQATRDATINQVLDQNRLMIESHRSLVEELRGFKDAVTRLTSTVEDIKTVKNIVNEELKSLKDSVSDLKSTVDAFSFNNVTDLIQEMRKEISELKKDKNKHNPLTEDDLYALDEEYGGEYNFNPNNLYPNLPARLPNSTVTFPPTLYPSLYPMYPYPGLGLPQAGALPFGQEAQLNELRVLNSLSQGMPQPNFVQPPLPPSIPPVKSAWEVGISQPPSLGGLTSNINLNQTQSTTTFQESNIASTSSVLTPVINAHSVIANNLGSASATSKKAPVNVVITSSDPLPTTSIQTTQILSVTIPPQHLKGKKQPHDYQIPLPTTAVTGLATTPAIMNQPSPIISTEGLLSNVAPPIYSAVTIKSPNKSTELGLHIERTLSQSFGNNSNNDEKSFNKSNTSSTSLEEHDPCPDFKPAVPLPDEVLITTGEENEKVLFCDRAKLFRFVNKEWRERGVGNLKILKNEENGKVRILMRRDIVHKICANHFLTKDMVLTPKPKDARAYMWAANDFADGEMIVEKLCVRFKTEEQASLFATAFEKAKLDLLETTAVDKLLIDKPISAIAGISTSSTSEKNNSLGGFIFTSPPTFKTLESTVTPIVTLNQDLSKNSPFATFTFGTKSSTASTPTNLFSTNVKPEVTSTPQKSIIPLSPKTPDEFTPTAEFTPVITLPDIVDIKTGEEDAEILFVERAKLLRFAPTKEWKERGTGNIKLLKQNNTIRLLMRREQVHKVCLNHQLLKNIVFSPMPKNPKALTWSAQDYSENTFNTEIFSIKFKTVEQTNAFAAAIELAQNSLDVNNYIKSDNTTKNLDHKEDKKVKGEPKSDSPKPTGWDDKFKPKPGHWECKNCYIINEGKEHNCIACETPKPNATPRKNVENNLSGAQFSFGGGTFVTSPEANKAQFSFGPSATSPSTGFIFGQKSVLPTTLSWGDAFKPKEGSWECSECLLRNSADKLSCMSCENPKDFTESKITKNTVNLDTPGLQFNFGLLDKETISSSNSASSWGDQFKPKPGTWECKLCYVRNDAENIYCLSCDSPKDDTVPKKDKSVDLSTPGYQFKFGIPQTNTDTSSTFSFVPKSAPIAAPQTSVDSGKTFSFGTSTTQNESTSQFVFGSPQQHAFEFHSRSPRRHSSGCDKDSDSFVEDEGEHIYFKPVIPLPDKIDVKSGEEDEQVLYCHRAKLYRFTNGEWKERGVGDIKILFRPETGRVRVLMRRDQVLKICLNHNLTHQIEYLPKDDKTWLFSAPDYSEGEINNWQFCLRFKNTEIAQEFKKAIDEALKKTKPDSDIIEVTKDSDSDVEFVSESKVTPEEEEEALKLQLPKNFMAYRQLPDCACDTCKNEDLLLENFKSPNESSDSKFLFGSSITQPSKATLAAKSESLKSILAKPSLLNSVDIPHDNKHPPTSTAVTSPENKSSFSTFSFSLETDAQPIPPATVSFSTQNMPIFGSGTTLSTSIFNFKPTTTGSIFTTPVTTTTTSNIFSSSFTPSNANLFNTPAIKTSTNGSLLSIPTTQSNDMLGSNTQLSDIPTIFGSGSNKSFSFGSLASDPNSSQQKSKQDDDVVLKCDSNLSFAALASNTSNIFSTPSKDDNAAPFASLGSGAPVFASLMNKQSSSSKVAQDNTHPVDETEGETSYDAEHDPHFEPIVPLPEAIVVSTGEEEEIAIFNERTKVYRFDNNTKEWKERGVGQLKILHHPVNGTYRFLLRREQVHKIVLNMLITPNLEIKEMSTSDKAYMWWGHNHVEGDTVLEKLAARFKNYEIKELFKNAVEKAVSALAVKQATTLPSTVQYFEEVNVSSQQDESVEDEDDEDDDDDDRSIMFTKNCIFSEEEVDGTWKDVCTGNVQLYYDPEIYGSRVCISNELGEMVSSSLIGMNTEIMVDDKSCIWRAVEWFDDGNAPRWRSMKVTFDDAEASQAFHGTFLESIQFAIESDLVDDIFLGGEEISES